MRANVLEVLLSSILRRGAAWRSLARDRGGAAGVYVAMISAVMVGMVGLTIDLGRLWTLNTEAQDAADAAALAAASQLDGTATATTRAYNAAQASTGLVTNAQALSSAGAGNVSIQTVDFLAALPASDTTAIAGANILCSGTGCTAAQSAQVHFVRVTTQLVPHQNWFLVAVGAPVNSATSAAAVAGNTPVMCQSTPVFICNPQEADPPTGQGSGAGFDITMWQGKQLLLTQGGGTTWQPGNYGLLDVPNCGGATSCLAQELASTPSGASCISTVSSKTGNVTPVNAAINTRFDIWFPPGFKNPSNVPASQLPAADVIKGLVPGTLGNGKVDCSSFVPPPGLVQALPRDNSFSGQNSSFGNGQWNCAGYMAVNHPSVSLSGNFAWCGASTDATANFPSQSRFNLYKEELGLNSPTIGIPNNSTKSPAGEDGQIPEQPNACATSTWSPPAGCSGNDPDLCTIANRRLLWFAVIDCRANSFSGSSPPIIPIAFVKGFITEPVGYVPGQTLNSSANQNIYLEFAGQATLSGGLLHDVIQLYR